MVSEFFTRGGKLQIYLVFIIQSYFAVPKKYWTKFWTIFYDESSK